MRKYVNVYGRSPILGPATSYDTVTCEDGPGWVRSNRSAFSFAQRDAARTVVLDVVLWNPGFTTTLLLSGARPLRSSLQEDAHEHSAARLATVNTSPPPGIGQSGGTVVA
ncbi:hypothetical protein GCM10009672_04480 [Nesterenkonia lutea]